MTNLKDLFAFMQEKNSHAVIAKTELAFQNSSLQEDITEWVKPFYRAMFLLDCGDKYISLECNGISYSIDGYEYLLKHKDMIMLHSRVIQSELVNQLTADNLTHIQHLICYWNDLESILGDL